LILSDSNCAFAHDQLHSLPTRRSSDLRKRSSTRRATAKRPPPPSVRSRTPAPSRSPRTSPSSKSAAATCSGNFELGEVRGDLDGDRKSTRLNSSHVKISYAAYCLKNKK